MGKSRSKKHFCVKPRYIEYEYCCPITTDDGLEIDMEELCHSCYDEQERQAKARMYLNKKKYKNVYPNYTVQITYSIIRYDGQTDVKSPKLTIVDLPLVNDIMKPHIDSVTHEIDPTNSILGYFYGKYTEEDDDGMNYTKYNIVKAIVIKKSTVGHIPIDF